MWKWIIGIIIVLAIAAAIYASTTTTQPVDTATAHRGSTTSYIEERAKTRLPRIYRITMPIDGRIMPIELTEGDAVTAGQVVARLEPEDLETEIARFEARVQRLQASIVENNDQRLEESVLEGIEHELVAIDRSVEAAEAKTDASKAEHDYHVTQLARITAAFETSAATQKELDEATLDEIDSRIDSRTDVLVLRALEAIREAARIWPRVVRQFIDKKDLTENVMLREMEEARAALELAVRNYQRGTMASPVDGVVLRRHVQNKRVLGAGEMLLEIGQLETLEVEADVLSQEAVDVTAVDTVDIFGPSIGREAIVGSVSRIEPQGFTKVSSLGVEQQRVRVIIGFAPDALPQLEEKGRQLGVDFRVMVRIHTDEADDAVIIPRSALFRGVGDQWQAFAVRGGRARLVDLQVGLMNDREVQVLDGIAADEDVILAPETSLTDGTRVRGRSD